MTTFDPSDSISMKIQKVGQRNVNYLVEKVLYTWFYYCVYLYVLVFVCSVFHILILVLDPGGFYLQLQNSHLIESFPTP